MSQTLVPKLLLIGTTVAVVVSGCRLRPSASDPASVSDGEFRFGRMEQVNTGLYILEEFKLCTADQKYCVNPFMTSIGGRLTRAMIVSMTREQYNLLAHQRKIEDRLSQVRRDQLQKVQPAEAGVVQADAYATAKAIDAQAIISQFGNQTERVSVLASEVTRLYNDYTNLKPNLDKLDQQLANQIANYQTQVSQKIIEASTLTAKIKDEKPFVLSTAAPRPRAFVYTSGKVDPTICACGSSTSNFVLKEHNERYFSQFSSLTPVLASSCDQLREDPPECRRVVVNTGDGKAEFSKTECHCLYVKESNGRNRRFPLPQGETSCSAVKIDADSCLTDEDRIARADLAQKYKIANDIYEADQKNLNARNEQIKQKNDAINSLEAQRANAQKNLPSDQASVNAAWTQANNSWLAAKAALADLSAKKQTAQDAQSNAVKVLQDWRDQLNRYQQQNQNALSKVLLSEFSADTITIASNANAISANDWNADPSQTVRSVPALIIALAKVYNFSFNCHMWENPFQKIGLEIEKKWPERKHAVCDDIEGDFLAGDYDSGHRFSNIQVKPGTFSHPLLGDMKVSAFERQSVVVGYQPGPNGQSVPIMGPGPVPPFGFMITQPDGSTCRLDDCTAGVCMNTYANPGCKLYVRIGILSNDHFVLIDQKTTEVFHYHWSEPPPQSSSLPSSSSSLPSSSSSSSSQGVPQSVTQ